MNLPIHSRESRAEKLLRHGVEAVTGLLIVLVLASVWWPRRAPLLPAQATVAEPTQRPPTDNTTALISAHLFGEARPAANTAVASRASITVDGIVHASSAVHSQALLTLNGKTNVYQVGDTLPDGEQVTAIDVADVELSGSGSARHLAMQTYGSVGTQGPAAYAALLHGADLSHNLAGSVAARGAGASSTPSNSLLAPTRLPTLRSAVAVRAVRVEPRATPLEQLRSLRSQLIR